MNGISLTLVSEAMGGNFSPQGYEVFSSSGGRFEDLSINENMLVTSGSFDKESCSINKNQPVVVSDRNSVRINYSLTSCSQDSYSQIRDTPGFQYIDLFDRVYKFNLDNEKGIIPVELDCMAYGDLNSESRFIRYAVRVKNTHIEGEKVNLECTLDDLPSGLYSVNYLYDSASSGSLIEIE